MEGDPPRIKGLILGWSPIVGDGYRDGNRGELWRTVANVGGRSTANLNTGRTFTNAGER